MVPRSLFGQKNTLALVLMSLVCAGVFALIVRYGRGDPHQRSRHVLSKLALQRCRRCGGSLGEWDGRFRPGDAHFNPGGYAPRIHAHCADCRAEQVLYVLWECRPEARLFEDNLECRLFNRDLVLSGFSKE